MRTMNWMVGVAALLGGITLSAPRAEAAGFGRGNSGGHSNGGNAGHSNGNASHSAPSNAGHTAPSNNNGGNHSHSAGPVQGFNGGNRGNNGGYRGGEHFTPNSGYRGGESRGGHTVYGGHDRYYGAHYDTWRGGSWSHTNYGGRYGWYWVAGGAYTYYAAPVYPYPAYVEPVYVEPVAVQPWYYCQSAGGYYPYVSVCPEGWQQVAPQ